MLWNHEREIVYATGATLSASEAEVAEGLEKGLRGKVSSTSLDAPDGKQVMTFVPLRSSPAGRTLAAFEVRRPLTAVAATAEPAPLDGLLPLLGALALAWGALQLVAYREGSEKVLDVLSP